MGYVAKYAGTEKLILSDPDYWVELRKCLSRAQLGETESLLTQAVVDMDGKGTVKPNVTLYRNTMVAFSIAAWNLDDDNGNVLPVNLATVGFLSGPDFDLVYNRVDKLNKGMTEDEQSRFPDQS